MTDTLSIALTAGLATAGVFAELNLLRIFVSDWRESRPVRQRRPRRRTTPFEALPDAPRSRRARATVVATSVIAAATTRGALAQQAAPPEGTTNSAALSPYDEMRLEASTKLTLKPSPGQPLISATEAAPLVISTDRPGFSDTTGIAPVNHLQLETGYTFTFRSRGGVETQRHNGPELLVRVGLIDDRLEIRATTTGYVWSRTDDGAGSGLQSTEGFSDVALGFKLKLTDQDGAVPRLAFEAMTVVGAGSRDISSRRAEPTVKLLWSYDLEKLWGEQWKGFGVYGNFNLAYPTTDGDRFLQGAVSICGTYAITDKLAVSAEYFVVGPAAKGADAAHSVGLGTTYLLDNRLQLDARVGFGLNRQADNVYVGIGLSFLF